MNIVTTSLLRLLVFASAITFVSFTSSIKAAFPRSQQAVDQNFKNFCRAYAHEPSYQTGVEIGKRYIAAARVAMSSGNDRQLRTLSRYFDNLPIINQLRMRAEDIEAAHRGARAQSFNYGLCADLLNLTKEVLLIGAGIAAEIDAVKHDPAFIAFLRSLPGLEQSQGQEIELVKLLIPQLIKIYS